MKCGADRASILKDLYEQPWLRSLLSARDRCENNTDCYKRIRCLLTPAQALKLWRRDQGWKLKERVLDRIDPTGDYSVVNCRFIEKRLNNARNRGVVLARRLLMQTVSIRISKAALLSVKRVATEEGRSIREQLERLIRTGLSLRTDQQIRDGLEKKSKGKEWKHLTAEWVKLNNAREAKRSRKHASS